MISEFSFSLLTSASKRINKEIVEKRSYEGNEFHANCIFIKANRVKL